MGVEVNMDEREKAKNELAEICYAIGCSGMNSNCPGDHRCMIVRKVMGKYVSAIKRNDD